MPRSPFLSRSTTLRAAAAVVALAATVPVAGARAAITPIACPTGQAQRISGPGIWQSFRAPTFSAPVGINDVTVAPQDIVAYAVDPTDPDRVAVTNGNSIYVSLNSGCNWTLGLRLDEVPADPRNMPLSGEFTKIVSLYIAPKNHRIFATAVELDTGATVGRPHVLYTNTDGDSWELGDDGLPPLGTPLTMRAAVTKPNVMYLSFANAREQDPGTTCPPPPVPCPGGEGTGRPLGLLWGSIDGGVTWTSRTDISDLNGSYPIKFLSIEDDDPTGNTLWVVANGQLIESTNGGRTYSVPDGLNQTNFVFSAVESINHGEHPTPIRLVAFSTRGEMLRLDGNVWRRTFVPFGPVESVAQRPEGDIAVATTPQAGNVTVWRIFMQDFKDYEDKVGLSGIKFRLTYGWEPITPSTTLRQNANIASGDSGLTTLGTFFLRDRRRVLRFLGSVARDNGVLAPAVPVNAAPPPRGRISPPVLTLNLARGRSQQVEYTLTLPPAPAPLDIFLLIDNSGSMQPLIDDLKQSMGEVVRSLSRLGVDVQAGVGQINVQPDKNTLPIDDPRTPDVDEGHPRPLYELLRRIGPIDSGFFRALSSIDGNGGSGDEAQLESLWQSVAGDGLSLTAFPALTGYSIKPHQQAGFRTKVASIKVIVHATDEPFSTNIQPQNVAHNSPGPVGAELNNAGVRQIGLSQGVAEAKRDLADMARRTGAVAPPGGTDCDGDGHADINAGEALVCDQNYGLDRTLVNLLKSLSDRQTISIDQATGPTLRAVSRTAFPINAKKSTLTHFTVTYSCVGLAAGSYDNTIEASLRGISIAKAVATVNCGGIPAQFRPDPEGPIAAPQVPVPGPIMAPIAPVNPIPQTNVQTQVNPQAGLAEQEQDQVQVATADSDVRTDEDEDELAMSRLGAESPWARPGLTLGAGMALASALATGVALRRRTRTRFARATVR